MKQWSQFGLLERVGLVAQLAAIASLFSTTYMAYLTVQEARHARSDLHRMFAGEKAPSIEVLAATAADEEINLIIKNVGDSVAQDVRLHLEVFGPHGGKLDSTSSSLGAIDKAREREASINIKLQSLLDQLSEGPLSSYKFERLRRQTGRIPMHISLKIHYADANGVPRENDLEFALWAPITADRQRQLSVKNK